MMNAHFCAAVCRICGSWKSNIDRLEWDHELFTHLPEIVDGYLVIPDRPGWSTEPNEEALRASAEGARRIVELRAEEVTHRSRQHHAQRYFK